MKFRWIATWVACVSVYSQTIAETKEIKIRGLSFEEFVSPTGEKFVSLRLKDFPEQLKTTVEGEPALPVLRFYVDSIPKVSVMESKADSVVKAPALVVPSQPSLEKVPQKNIPFVLKREAYNRRPSKISRNYEVKDAGQWRGVKRYLVTLYPVTYDPVSGDVSLRSQFQITTEDKKETLVPRQERFAVVVAETYVQSASLEKFKSWKRSLGFDVVELVINDSNRTPQSIRSWLQGVYRMTDSKLVAAILIGEANEVPGFVSGVINGPSDHYFRALDTYDYASDINGPDIGVGRFSPTSEEDLSIMLERTMTYERGDGPSFDWLKQSSFLATDDKWQLAEGTHNYAIDKNFEGLGMNGSFPRMPMLGGDQLYAVTHRAGNQDVIRSLREGRGIINYSGHGATTFWDAPRLTQSDIRRETNPASMPFVISNACITGDYRVSESFAETWQRSRTGAVMFWGSMDNTYWDEDDILEKRMYDAIFDKKLFRFQDFMDQALAEVWKSYGGNGRSIYYWETYTTFGDPSLWVRTEIPQSAGMNPAFQPAMGQESFQTLIQDENGKPVPGARVLLERSDLGLLEVTYANQMGEIGLDLRGFTSQPGQLKVLVSGPNLKVSSQEFEVASLNQPFLGIEWSDSSKVIEAGQTKTLSFVVKNRGNQPTRGGSIELKSQSASLKILNGRIQVPALKAGESVSIDSGLSVKAESTASSEDYARASLDWNLSESTSGNATLRLNILAPLFKLKASRWLGETDGINPGDSGELEIELQDFGDLSYSVAHAQIKDGQCFVAEGQNFNLVPGNLKWSLRVSARNSCVRGSRDHLDIVLQASETRSEFAIPLTVGAKSTAEFSTGELPTFIPDRETSVFFLNVDRTGELVDLEVKVTLLHSYIGDLEIYLVAPTGDRVKLRERSGMGEDNLDVTYSLANSPGLKSLVGKNPSGNWRLEVVDMATSDTGTMKSFDLKLIGYF